MSEAAEPTFISMLSDLISDLENPNALGEALRALTFPGEGFGCYSNFETRVDTDEWATESRRAFYADYVHNEDAGDLEDAVQAGRSFSSSSDGYRIECCWFWDGDGILCYAVYAGPVLVRALENWDCKKNYVWQDSPKAATAFELARSLVAA